MAARIRYGGKEYVLRDQLVFQQISEFNTAIRQGAANNDDRNLASFFSFEDARGGIGTVYGQVREDPDKLADSDGVITFKFNQAIKPPKIYERTLTGSARTPKIPVFYETAVPSGTAQLVLGIEDEMWYNTVSGHVVSWAKNTNLLPSGSGHAIATQCLDYISPQDGVLRLFIASVDSTFASAQPIIYTTNPKTGTFTAVSPINTEILFEFDGKLFAEGNGILRWSIDPTNSAAWNVLTPASGAWPRTMRMIGVLPFGEQSFWPYVLANYRQSGYSFRPSTTRLAVLDLDAARTIPISLGLSDINDAFVHQGKICLIHDNGRAVTLFDPKSFTQMNLDWGAESRDGFLSPRPYLARFGISHPAGIVIAAEQATTDTQLFLHKGGGWIPYGQLTSVGASRAYYSSREQRFYLADSSQPAQVADIKWWNEAFTPGVNQSIPLEDEDLAIITPWFDLGFSELSGTLLTLNHGGYADASNTVAAYYQLDLDSTAWTLLGTFPNTAPEAPEITGRSRPVEDERTLLFSSLEGITFNRVRFKFLLHNVVSGDGNAYQTPNAYPMTVRFMKRPDLRESIRIAIDPTETIAMRDDINSLDELWMELKALYDSHDIPKLEAGPVTTWAAMIALPRVLEISGLADDDIVPSTLSEELTIVFNVAELV